MGRKKLVYQFTTKELVKRIGDGNCTIRVKSFEEYETIKQLFIHLNPFVKDCSWSIHQNWIDPLSESQINWIKNQIEESSKKKRYSYITLRPSSTASTFWNSQYDKNTNVPLEALDDLLEEIKKGQELSLDKDEFTAIFDQLERILQAKTLQNVEIQEKVNTLS